jgi:hypothetical protein
MELDQLIKLLQDRLTAVGHGIDFEIVQDGVRRDGDWWYVPILATRNGQDVAREFTVNVYANIEDEIQQRHGVSVLFVPAVNEPAGQ